RAPAPPAGGGGPFYSPEGGTRARVKAVWGGPNLSPFNKPPPGGGDEAYVLAPPRGLQPGNACCSGACQGGRPRPGLLTAAPPACTVPATASRVLAACTSRSWRTPQAGHVQAVSPGRGSQAKARRRGSLANRATTRPP